MKILVAIFAVALMLASFGCGEADVATSGGTESEASGNAEKPKPGIRFVEEDPHFGEVSVDEGSEIRPAIEPPNMQPPDQMLVRDLVVGTGRVAEKGDEVSIWYSSVTYDTGERAYSHWYDPPWVFTLQGKGSHEAWEEGIVGMREGGRREMVIPAHRQFTGKPVIYVIELFKVEPGSSE